MNKLVDFDRTFRLVAFVRYLKVFKLRTLVSLAVRTVMFANAKIANAPMKMRVLEYFIVFEFILSILSQNYGTSVADLKM